MFPSPERSANALATVFVPAKGASGVTESIEPAANAEEVKIPRMQVNAALYALGSGTCRFQCTLPEAIR